MTAIKTESFIPLPCGAPARAGGQDDFRVLVLEQAENAQPFRGELTTPAATPGAVPCSTPAKPGCEPRVSLQREGNRVVGIHVECSCGQVIELVCVYQAS